jgi:hypothetical protein
VLTADLDYPKLLSLARAAAVGLIPFRGGFYTEREVIDRLARVLEAVPTLELTRAITTLRDLQCALNGLGLPFDDPQEDAGGSFWLSAALLPFLDCPLAQSKAARELGLSEAQTFAYPPDVGRRDDDSTALKLRFVAPVLFDLVLDIGVRRCADFLPVYAPSLAPNPLIRRSDDTHIAPSSTRGVPK